MATTVQTIAGLSLLVHTLLFTSLNLYIYFRSQSLNLEYQQESEVLDLLIENCETHNEEWSLDQINDLHGLYPTKEDVHIKPKKRQLSPLEMMMADLLKAQEMVLEQHCINNTRLCVHGANGEIGVSGLKGAPGEKGDPGLQPQRAPPGMSGRKGDSGMKGEKGVKGPRGSIGELGEKGDSGLKGPKGNKGDIGDKGSIGDPGVSGEKGDVGPSGPPGDQGDPGRSGEKGDIGPKGFQGLPGDKGDNGLKGTPGKDLDPKCLCKAPKQRNHLIQSRILDRVMMACPIGNGTLVNVTWSKEGSSQVPVRMVKNGNDLMIPEVYPGDVGIYKCNAQVLDSNGRIVTVQRNFEIKTPTGVDRHDCDFEKDLCTWTQSKGDNFDLLRHQGSTITAVTGPTSDHTIGGTPGGHYLFMESSDQQKGDKAVLVSSDFFNTQPQCLTFWYHMFGRDTASLSVILQGSSNTTIWTKSGDQGNSWQRAIVEIPTSLKRHQVLLEVTEGTSYHGDIAIDDIIVLDGPCTTFNKTPQ
ncbi:uncharacterized protein LOC133198658 [Saccostrea echinata]|uniref:uncharacterized protein LOC133198658 n=1 Tax=Saccostrea echinata TaxID=191078 RepID=UPI002A83D640|nr:uncharacterized protein LOC133198658 [Saccostrea echinata]